jgi:hypothetical protein
MTDRSDDMGRPRLGLDATVKAQVSYPVSTALAYLSSISGNSQAAILRNALVGYLEPMGLLLDDEPRHVNDSKNQKKEVRR